jgi:NAD-dependent dihydropyrimidine dehydrogenase PreA subunit/flavodoxin
MIYYFSGTGNSKWIAEELARRTGDAVQSIAQLLNDGPVSLNADQNSIIGIVFPVYAWGAPLIVEQFCRSVTLANGAYAYAVCSCGDEAGKAMNRLKKFFTYQSAWSIAMPNNYIMGYDVDSPALEQRKIALATEKVGTIAQAILAQERVYDVHEGSGAAIKTALVRPMFNRFARTTKPFFADENCNDCGLCARICPIHAIKMEGGKPRWVKLQCTKCTGCINRCPQRAIQYGKGTAAHGRYYRKSGSRE